MPTSRNLKLFFTTFGLATLTIVSVPQISIASDPNTKTSKPPCRIDIDNAHLSTSVFHRQGVRVVIVKARSICDVMQQRVMLTVQIYKTEILGDKLITSSNTNPQLQSSSGYVISNNGTTYVCKTHILTHYYGIAFSKAFINGRWLYAGRTQSPETVPLPCGT